MPRPRHVKYYEAVFWGYEPLIARSHTQHSSSASGTTSASLRVLFTRPTMMVNTLLAGIAVVAFLAYVSLANSVGAIHFSNTALNEQVASVNERNGALEAQHTQDGSTIDLMEFARRHNMVPASSATHVFAPSGVALSR